MTLNFMVFLKEYFYMQTGSSLESSTFEGEEMHFYKF